jgi:hypothetical protein
MVAILLAGSMEAGLAQAPEVDYKRVAAARLELLGQCNQALGSLQQLKAQEEAGIVGNVEQARALAIRQTEDRIATVYAKEHPGKVLDPKTGKVTDKAAGK